MESASHWYFYFILNNPNQEGQLVIYIEARLCCAVLPLEWLNTPEVLLQVCSCDRVIFTCSTEGLLARLLLITCNLNLLHLMLELIYF